MSYKRSGLTITCTNCHGLIEPRWSKATNSWVWPWKCPTCEKHALTKKKEA